MITAIPEQVLVAVMSITGGTLFICGPLYAVCYYHSVSSVGYAALSMVVVAALAICFAGLTGVI